LKSKKVCFGDTQVIHIETVPGACKKPQNSHNLAYEHPPERQMLESECEAHVAHVTALTWHEVTCREYGIPCVLFH
jgi:archaellum component FlaD/FlaE